MSHSRREFIQRLGASALVIASSDRIGELLAQSPTNKVMESKFKGLCDIALAEAKRAGCSYADIRFTRNLTYPGVNVMASNAAAGAAGAGAGGRGGRGGARGGGGGGGGGVADLAVVGAEVVAAAAIRRIRMAHRAPRALASG